MADAPTVTPPPQTRPPATRPDRPAKGRSFRPGGARQSVIELLRFTEKVPAIPQLRRTRIPRLAAVRAAATEKVSWPMLFFAAYARVCARRPELRTVYVRWPYTRLYEHPHTVGRMTVARDIEGEEVVLLTLQEDAESKTLRELHEDLKTFALGDPADCVYVQRQARMNRMPWVVKFLGWKVLLWSGRLRTRALGTFGVTTVSKFGGVTLAPPTFATTMLSFGPVSPDGDVDVVLSYDHRVLDGADNARAMAELERELETGVADELEAMQP